MRAMRERYPDVRLHMVESLSGHLSDQLNARQLDLAVLFDARLQATAQRTASRRWQVLPLIEEDLFLICARHPRVRPLPATLRMKDLRDEPLILPTGSHGLRSTLDTAFARAKLQPQVVLEVDSLSMLMAAVDHGLGSTIQPWAAIGRYADGAQRFQLMRITDPGACRVNLLCSLSEEELSPAALATRAVLRDCVTALVSTGTWQGTRLVAG